MPQNIKIWVPIIVVSSLVILILGVWVFVPLMQLHPSCSGLTNYEQATLTKQYIDVVVRGIGTVATVFGSIFLFLNYKNAISRLAYERFAKAVEQLSASSIHARLGGIYSLGLLEKDSPELHEEIVSVLSTFVREEVSKDVNTDSEQKKFNGEQQNLCKELPEYIRRGLIAIWRIKKNKEIIDLRGANFSYFNLQGLNFQDVDFTGANLSYADLSNVDFRDATLTKACLHHSILYSAQFLGSNLRRADLMGAKLDAADFRRADLSHSILHKAEFSEANFSEANLSKADMSSAICSEANFEKANLYRAILKSADLCGANLSKATLIKVDLHGANLSSAKLSEANIEGADLSLTNFSYARLDSTNMNECILLATNCRSAKFLTLKQFETDLPPLLCNVALPSSLLEAGLSPDRNCDEIPSALLGLGFQDYSLLEACQRTVDEYRQKQWE